MATARYQRQTDAPSIRTGLVAAASIDPFEDAVDMVEKFSRGARIQGAEHNAMADVMAGKTPNLAPAMTEAQFAYNEAAGRAYEAKTSVDLRAKANELATQYDGRDPSHPGAFAQTFDAYSSSLLAQVPAELRPQIQLEVQARRSEALAHITDRANRFEFDRNTSAIEEGIKANVDDAAAAARDGRLDLVNLAVSKANDQLESLVNLGVINADEADIKRGQVLASIHAEKIMGDFARGGYPAGRIAAVESGDDPETRGMPLDIRDRLVGKMRAGSRRVQMEARRGAAAVAAGTRKNAASARDILTVAKTGANLREDETDFAHGVIHGSIDIGDDYLREELTVAVLSQDKVADFVTKPLEQGQREAREILDGAATRGDRREIAVAKNIVEAVDKKAKALEADPVQWLHDSQTVSLTPLDLSSPAALGETLRNRSVEVEVAGENEGRTFPTLSNAEVSAIERHFVDSGMGENDQLAYVTAIVGSSSDRGESTIRRMNGGKSPHLAAAGMLVANGREEVAGELLRGAALMKSPEIPKMTPTVKAALPTAAIYTAVPSEVGDRYVAATEKVYAARMVDAGRSPADGDPDVWAQAQVDVGGKAGAYNDAPLLLPIGVVDEGDFADRVESVTGDELVAMGADPATAEDTAAALRTGGGVNLTSTDPGRYRVRVGGVTLRDAAGGPLVLDFDKIAPKQAVRSDSVTIANAEIPVGDVARTIGKGVDAAMETGKAVIHNTTDPLAAFVGRYAPRLPR